jgi:two-component system, chemotaxis family, sensor histidine kinase and response regulator PixL
MSKNKEREIQLQFLDEAQEYLGTLDSALLGLATGSVDIDKMNAALRSAHSIKGGAGMMGFQTLSQLAHHLEDSLKVLKIQRHSIALDADLEGLLLSAVDCLRQIIHCDREAFLQENREAFLQENREAFSQENYPQENYRHYPIYPDGLEQQATLILEQLHDRLGDPEAEDANSILSPEEGQEIIPLLFQTEVEGCLTRLESVIEQRSPCLREEVDILAQELGGLGEMLQIPAFSRLCTSALQAIAVAPPDRVEAVAQLTLQAWRRSQALILTGHFGVLPDALEGIDCPADAAGVDAIVPEIAQEISQEVAQEITDSFFAQNSEFDQVISESNETSEFHLSEVNLDSTPAKETTFSHPAANSTANLTPSNSPTTVKEPANSTTANSTAANSTTAKETPENSVRVSTKQLDQLNDLFGELTIERNGLDLHVKRLRGLTRALTQRIQLLEQSNSELRTAYDRITRQPDSRFSLPDLHLSRHSHRIGHDTPLISPQPHSFLHRFDSLEMDRYSDLHLMSQEVMETIVQIQEVASDIDLSLDDTEQTARELNKTSRQLRTKLTQVRMRPFSDVTDRFPRFLRELSLQYDKPVQLQVHGASILIDRNILEALSDPLMHLLRNAFDHGIEAQQIRSDRGKPEAGLIEIHAAHRNNRTVISVRDDGGGIALEKVRAKARQMGLDGVLLDAASDEELLSLIFEPGFSTNDQVTALSGRGVGMDVVRDRLRQIQGEIKVDTQPGLGTTFTLSVPFTLSVARVLIAESHGMLMAFPIDAIEEMLLLPPEEIISTAGGEAFSWQGTMVQLIRLSRWLEFRRAYPPEGLETPAAIGVPTVLLVAQGSQMVGLQIDRSWGEQEVAIRKVEGGLPMSPGFSNCTILGDGRVVPLVNLPDLLRWITTCERSQADTAALVSLSSGGLSSGGLSFGGLSSGGLSFVHTASRIAGSSSDLLPIASQDSAAPSFPPPSFSTYIPERLPTVLIIDDSINVRRLLALTLEKAGYQVAQAKDGQDALEKLSAGLQVNAVICDIEMPRLDGYGFLAKVKASPPLESIPIAMLTSRSGDKHRQLAMSLGASAYFSKPYSEQALLQTLGSLMA